MNISILNAELFRVHTEWQHQNVNSPYSRMYYIVDGKGYISHHGKRYHLSPGNLYLIPAFTKVDLYCPESFLHYYVHFVTELDSGMDIFQIANCSYKIKATDNSITTDMFDRLIQLNPGLELIERDANKPIYQVLCDRARELNFNKSIADYLQGNAIMLTLLAAFFRTEQNNEAIGSTENVNRIQFFFKSIPRGKKTPQIVCLSP